MGGLWPNPRFVIAFEKLIVKSWPSFETLILGKIIKIKLKISGLEFYGISCRFFGKPWRSIENFIEKLVIKSVVFFLWKVNLSISPVFISKFFLFVTPIVVSTKVQHVQELLNPPECMWCGYSTRPHVCGAGSELISGMLVVNPHLCGAGSEPLSLECG